MIGTKLAGRYEVLAELGQGGMGVVYRARDQVLGREVAIKIISATGGVTDDAERRFRSEAQTIAQLGHPAIISIYDFGRDAGVLFYVMPVIEGLSLQEMIRATIDLPSVIDIGIAVAEALAYTHARGIVHRDVKPANILVSRGEQGVPRVTVMDFGLARSVDDDPLTRTGVLIGTVAYLSPENITGKMADAASDIYALGNVLYECIAGEPPFVGEPQTILYRIAHEYPQPLHDRGITVDPELAAIVMSCLAKAPIDRPASMAALARSLRQVRARLLHAGPTQNSLVVGPVRRAQATPLIGRQHELADLQQRLNRMLTGEGHFVVLGGDAGVGKTRLVAELESLASARGLTVLHGQLAEQDGPSPYYGLCEVLVDFFRQRETGGGPLPELADVAGDLIACFPTLGEIEALRAAAGELPHAATTARASDNRAQLFEALARVFVRLTSVGPLLLVFEDLHAAGASIEALQYIVRRLAATPTLIVATYRTTEVERHHPIHRMLEELRGSRRFASLTLGPLSRSEHRNLLTSLLGDVPVSDLVVDHLYATTEGNPFFTGEVVRSLLSNETAAEGADTWLLLSPSHLSSALPATIQQAIDRRLGRLPEALREILVCATVIGKTFDARELEQLAREGDDLDEAIDRLVQEGLLVEERSSRGDRLSFASGVVREVLYAQIPRRRRRGLHRRYATYLEGRYANRIERVYAQLLHHYAEGDVPDQSVLYGIRAARQSIAAFNPDEAIRAARTALEFLDEEWQGDPAAHGEVRELLAAAYRMNGNLDGALREAEAAITVYRGLGRPADEVRCLLLAARTAWQARLTDDTRRWVDLGLAAARGLGQLEVLAQLLALAATLASLRGDSDLAAEYLHEVELLDRDAGRRDERGPRPAVGGRLVVALATPPHPEPAAAQTQDDIEVLANIFETLLVAEEDGHLLPCLCERWEPRRGGESFVFTLRPDVRFHDGHVLTAATVVASLTDLIRRRAGEMPAAVAVIDGAAEFQRGEASEIRGLKATGEHRLEIELTQPLQIYPAFLTNLTTAITHVADDTPGAQRLVAGTGPFKLVSIGPRSAVIERFPEHWRGVPANLDSIEFRTVDGAAALAAGLRARELDLIGAVAPELVDAVGTMVEAPLKQTFFALFNANSGPNARRPEVRRALAEVVPVQELVWQVLGRFGVPASGLVPPGILGHDPGRRRRRLTEADARALLDSAGIVSPIRVLLFPVIRERYRALLDALIAVWSNLGVTIELVPVDLASFASSGELPDAIDILLIRWGADYDDPDDFTFGNFHSQSGRLRRCFSSPEADRLLELGRSEVEPAARERYYREFEDLLQHESILLPLFYAVDHRIAGPDVVGLHLRSSPPYANYAEISRRAAQHRRKEPSSSAVIRVPLRGQVMSLDPTKGDYMEYQEVLPSIFESLTRRVGTAQIVPWLAESIEVQAGGTSYRFRLRRGVTFHDGHRLTARDVRYSFERMLRRPDAGDRWLYAPIVGASAMLAGEASELAGFHIHSAHEFTIEIVRPLVYFPGLLSHGVCAIVPEGADQRGDRWFENPVGTGPFRVVHFDPGRRLELERAVGYWRPGYPRCRELVFHFGVPAAEIRAGFEAGRFAIAGELLPEDVEVLRRDPRYAAGYRETPAFGTYFVAFNVVRGPLADPGLRRQIAQAIDRVRFARQTIGRLAKPAHSLIPPGLLGYEPEVAVPAPVSDSAPTTARDVVLTALVHPVFFGEYKAYFRRLTETLAGLGVHLQIYDQTYNIRDLADPTAMIDINFTRWFADYPDAHSFLNLLHTCEGRLGALCGSERCDRLLEKGQATADPQLRHAIYRQTEDYIQQEVCLLPLFHPQTYRFARPEVEGLEVSHGGPCVIYDELAMRSDSAGHKSSESG
ncbi:ABC transporter substrate-binding protein [Nannocystis sp.]|uniref:ABC transporter substrate-binding protein n=1 Tax=Nannocystis sp. TaxID=1962667 RepID=UPI0025ED295B|nr:ABC transporter substrate-binding protein [Nannocystis sp.]MBK7829059.1 protein kinase [Nannocystis sp.]